MTAVTATRLDRNADPRSTAGGIVVAGGFVAVALASVALPEAAHLGAWLAPPGRDVGSVDGGALLVAFSVGSLLALAVGALAGIRKVAATARR